MSFNIMSCPTCGHSVSNASGACAYCGALMTEDQQPPTEDTEAAVNAQSVESPPASTEPEASAPADVSVPVDEMPVLTQDRSPSPGSQELTELSLDTDATIQETDAHAGVEEKQALIDTEGQPTSMETEPESKTSSEIVPPPVEAMDDPAGQSNEELDTESVAGVDGEVVLADPEAENDPNANRDEPAGPDSKEAKTDSTAAEVELTPEPNLVDVAVDEPGESEISEKNVVELDEINDIQEELEKTSIPEMSAPSDTSLDPSASESPESPQPESDVKFPMDAKAGLNAPSLDDTIILEVADEVQPEAEKAPHKSDNSAQTSAAGDALKIEKAAQDLTAAVNKQKAAMAETQKKIKQEAASTKVEAIKQQKAALAKTHAVKKQKMILAKAAAIKRKKAAQAKAQALKKQEAARAGVENARKDEGAATIAAAAGKHKQAKDPETSSELKKLLEKYKGQAVGINYDNSADIREAQLVEANGEYFSVLVREKNLHYSYPLKTILTVIEGRDGVEAGESEKKSKFNAVIKVYPLVLF